MTDLPPDSNAPMPLWVKVFGIAFILLVIVIVILHISGRGFGGHT